MKFFDLHSHPVVKTLFKERGDALSAWVPIEFPIKLANGMESQCSLDQIRDTKINLLCFTRHAVERGMLDQWLLQMLALIYYSKLDRKRLKRMAHGVVTYAKQLDDEWHNLYKHPDGKFPNQALHNLTNLKDYNENNPDTFYLIYNIEGGHIFNQVGDDCDDVDINTIRSILKKLNAECPMIFYITPTHLTPNNLITHAYGNKILDKKPFLPNSFGICKTGETIIYEIYKENILVDVKHMSLISRKKFYEIHDEHFKDKAIIASHVAFTGLSVEDLKHTVIPIKKGQDFVKIEQPASDGIIHYDKYDPVLKAYNPGLTKFNPNSINLYDEEIEIILKSKGLIGLIFDVRILGAEIKNSVTEFLSIPEYEEWKKIFGVPDEKTLKANDTYIESSKEVFYQSDDVDEFFEEMKLYFPDEYDDLLADGHFIEAKTLQHLLHFINHILYIARLWKKKNLQINPWKHICIGSDFDGLIAPMYCCRNVTKLPGFAEDLRQRIPEEAANANIEMPTKDIDEFINDLFFDNARRALEEHFGFR